MQLANVVDMLEGAMRSGSLADAAARAEEGESRDSASSGATVCSIFLAG